MKGMLLFLRCVLMRCCAIEQQALIVGAIFEDIAQASFHANAMALSMHSQSLPERSPTTLRL